MSAPAARYQADGVVGVVDHEVHVEREIRHALERFDDRRTDRQVGHEVPVHDIHVDEVSSRSLHHCDSLAKTGEVAERIDGAIRIRPVHLGLLVHDEATVQLVFGRATMSASVPLSGDAPS